MRPWELATAIIIPIIGLILFLGFFFSARRVQRRAEARDRRWSERYGSRAGKRLENHQRVWRMFGMEYPGTEEDLVSETDEETEWDPRGHRPPRRNRHQPGGGGGGVGARNIRGGSTGAMSDVKTYGTMGNGGVDTVKRAHTGSSQKSHQSRLGPASHRLKGSFGHESEGGVLKELEPTAVGSLTSRASTERQTKRHPELAVPPTLAESDMILTSKQTHDDTESRDGKPDSVDVGKLLNKV